MGEVSSANSLGLDAKRLDNWLIEIKSNSGPRIELWRTLALAHEEYRPLNLTLPLGFLI